MRKSNDEAGAIATDPGGNALLKYESLRLPTVDSSAPTHFDCMGDHFNVVTALSALQPEVVAGLADRQVMAGRGQPFNEGEIVGDGIPQRRFGSAAVGQSLIFADAEQGGVAYYTEIWAFERHGTHWTGNRLQYGGSLPNFFSTACTH